MRLYLTVLFFHVGSALVLAAALGVDWMLLVRLRKASSACDAQSWLGMWAAVPWAASLSLLVLLLTGGYMVGRFGQWSLAWPKAALVTLVLIGAVGGISSKRMRAARRACGAEPPGDSGCLRLLRSPILKISVNTRIALLFAAVLLMTMTPRLYASSAIVVGGVLLGFLVSLPRLSRQNSREAVDEARESRA